MNSHKSWISLISMLQRAYCTIDADGLQFTAEDSRTVQAKAYLPKALFREFKWPEGDDGMAEEGELSFVIDIKALSDCLSIFGSHQQQPHSSNGDTSMQQSNNSVSVVSLQLSYPRSGGELTLM